MTKQQWAFSVLPFSVTQEFSAQQGLKYELSLRLIQKHSLPLLFARDYHTHMSFTVASAVHCIQNQTAQFQGSFHVFIAVQGLDYCGGSCGE